jgi:ribonuclease J
MPVHGETRHLMAHARLGKSVGMADEDIFVMETGDCLEIDEQGRAELTGKVSEAGVVYVDGLHVGDVNDIVLRDRQQLSSDGIATVVVAINGRTHQVQGEPELIVRGLPVAESAEMMDQARARIRKALNRMQKEGVTDHGVIQRAVRDALSQYLWESLRRRPMIIPVIMEV